MVLWKRNTHWILIKMIVLFIVQYTFRKNTIISNSIIMCSKNMNRSWKQKIRFSLFTSLKIPSTFNWQNVHRKQTHKKDIRNAPQLLENEQASNQLGSLSKENLLYPLCEKRYKVKNLEQLETWKKCANELLCNESLLVLFHTWCNCLRTNRFQFWIVCIIFLFREVFSFFSKPSADASGNVRKVRKKFVALR